MRTPIGSSGYPLVELAGKTYSVHRLVAQAFIPNPDNLPQVNHKDEIKTNNTDTNLEWCTKAYNTEYSCAKVHNLLLRGEPIEIHNLAKYCKKHNLNQGNLNQVALGQRNLYKEYTQCQH
jgi:hypothetical protein